MGTQESAGVTLPQQPNMTATAFSQVVDGLYLGNIRGKKSKFDFMRFLIFCILQSFKWVMFVGDA